jgi:hypothetical protein
MAFSLARSKIKLSFFVELLSYTIKLIYLRKKEIKRWKGYLLLAVDGTGIRVPDTASNRKIIGVHKNQHGEIAASKILAVHDVLNRVFYYIFLHPRSVAELVALHLNFTKIPTDAITIYDRHYCDSLLLARHLKSKKPCLIRMKTKGIKVVENFLKSDKTDAIVEFQVGERAYYSARDRYGLKNKYPKFSTFKIRLVRVLLSTGEVEVLATNLFNKKKFPASDFKDLYGKRWGVETAFDEVKNQLKLGMFSGYKTNVVLQDLWSVFIFYNIRSMFLREAQLQLDKEKKEVQINRNIAISILQKDWFEILHSHQSNKYIKQAIKLMKRYYEKRRIRPPIERKRKHIRANERYMTEKNYKPAF